MNYPTASNVVEKSGASLGLCVKQLDALREGGRGERERERGREGEREGERVELGFL